jgi:hypothetical protein
VRLRLQGGHWALLRARCPATCRGPGLWRQTRTPGTHARSDRHARAKRPPPHPPPTPTLCAGPPPRAQVHDARHPPPAVCQRERAGAAPPPPPPPHTHTRSSAPSRPAVSGWTAPARPAAAPTRHMPTTHSPPTHPPRPPQDVASHVATLPVGDCRMRPSSKGVQMLGLTLKLHQSRSAAGAGPEDAPLPIIKHFDIREVRGGAAGCACARACECKCECVRTRGGAMCCHVPCSGPASGVGGGGGAVVAARLLAAVQPPGCCQLARLPHSAQPAAAQPSAARRSSPPPAPPPTPPSPTTTTTTASTPPRAGTQDGRRPPHAGRASQHRAAGRQV